jgi:hypothetical protein
MPRPVYVWDAQERPLLPTSPAYARVLLRTEKAQRVPHPALQIIQLSQPIVHPASPPVVLAVELRGAIAELLLVMERAGQPIVLHRLLLDLKVSAALSQEPVDTATMLDGVWRGLGHLLPITHLVVFRVAGRSVTLAPEAVSDEVCWLRAALPALRADATRRPALAAVWLAQTTAAQLVGADRDGVISHVLSPPSATVGATARIARSVGHATGLITDLHTDSCTVLVPIVAAEHHLSWQTEVVPLAALQCLWRPTEVAILPLGVVLHA